MSAPETEPSSTPAEATRPMVVGVGASAGGLDPLRALVGALPADTPFATVCLIHHDPARPSALARILATGAALPVSEATDGEVLQAGHVYTVAAGSTTAVVDGVFRVTAARDDRYHPIDVLLESIADASGPRGCGVLLSGTGSDGARGLAALRVAGGATFVQDHTASFGDMPRAAVAAGAVDQVLSPVEIAEALLRVARVSEVDDGADLSPILELLSRTHRVDFAGYKPGTLQRRIRRRMALRQIRSAAAYLEDLQKQPAELDALFEDVLIHVTRFFRDPASHAALRNTVFPALCAGRSADDPLRIWVVGCATGEEAYSVAINLLEYLDEHHLSIPIRLLATDVSDAVLRVARAGNYGGQIAEDVSAARLQRFFTTTPSGYQIRKSVRELCIFSNHDIARDPPFSRLDLVCCRNVFIYLGPQLQAEAMSRVRYALKPGGFLWLGPAEGIGRDEDGFELDRQNERIYRRRPGQSHAAFDATSLARPLMPTLPEPRGARTRERGDSTLPGLADQLLLARHAPAGAVVDDRLGVIEFRGDTDRFLRVPEGSARMDLLRVLRDGLLGPVSEAIEQARTSQSVSRRDAVVFVGPQGDHRLDLTVEPLADPITGERGFLVLFVPLVTPVGLRPRVEAALRARSTGMLERLRGEGTAKDRRIDALEHELVALRAYLRALVFDHEAAEEELRAAHEETLSSNEELQSTIEELETAKEELQAGNEELKTVNDELLERNREVSRVGDDLRNLLTSSGVAILMLDRAGAIRSFTASAAALFGLTPDDVGRPFGGVRVGLPAEDLELLLRTTLDSMQVQQCEFVGLDGHWLELRVHPYRTGDLRVDGAVVTAHDIDVFRRSDAVLRRARDVAQAIVETVRHPLLVLDGELQVRSANRAFFDAHGLIAGEVMGRALSGLRAGGLEQSAVLTALRGVLERNEVLEDAEFVSDAKEGTRSLRVTARLLPTADVRERLVLVAAVDVTHELRARTVERELVERVLAAQAAERERLARELHDETGQTLTAALFGLRLLEDSITDPKVVAKVTELRTGLRRLVDDIGRIARGLHPTALADVGLGVALDQLCREHAQRYGTAVELRVDADASLEALRPALSLAVFRVVQEALTNTAKHANARHIAVILRRVGGRLHAAIEDDGSGFDYGAARGGQGLGLVLMDRHVRQLGGELHVTPREGGGAVVTAEFPDPDGGAP